MADLTDRLRAEGREFSFFQAVRLVSEYFGKKDNDSFPLVSGRMRLTADPSLCFPSSDISGVDGDSDAVRMILSFMGLSGVSSPLPNYFSDYLARHPEDSAALADFCAIFNHRIYSLFYEAFWKYRFSSAVFSPAMLDRLMSMGGGRSSGKSGTYRTCAYLGRLSTRRRGAQGLAAMLSDYFGAIETGVTQWMPRRVALPNPTKIDGSAVLGVNAMVGTEMMDYSGKFRVTIGPLRREKFEAFLEGSENLSQARRLIASYVIDPLAFDLEIKLEAVDLVPVVLGRAEAGLGRTSSLGECAIGTKGEPYSIVLDGRQ
jgi:type VI secretion system protein ImpH